MSAEDSDGGLNAVADGAASIAGTLAGAGVRVEDAEGHAAKSGVAALAVSMWFAYLNEAALMLEQGYATRDDIDAAMRFGCGYPVGPLRMLDEIGIDKAVAVLGALHDLSGDPRHHASAALTDRVASGAVGRVVGRGFYHYAQPDSEEITDAQPAKRAAGPTRRVQQVGVVGTGTMATGIVEVFAKAGCDVTFVARSQERADAALAAVAKSLDRAVGKGRMEAADRDATLARVIAATSVDALSDADIVVEAIVEDLEPKQQLFAALDQICKTGAILATTTSSLSIAQIARVTNRPADVIGMHFFNPATIMKLVEVVTTSQTAPDVTDTVVDLCARMKKVAVLCGDRAGFIVNFLLFPYLNDAARAIDEGLTTVEAFDPVIKNWQRVPMGPFSLLDVVGNDVSLAIEETIYRAFGDQCYRPAKGLKKIVAAGKLGRKTGAGFLQYG